MTVQNTVKRLLKNHSILEVAECVVDYMAEDIKGKNCLSNPEKVIDFAKLKIGLNNYESFLLIFMNIKNEVLAHEIINEGTIDQAIIYPRRVIEKALYHDAAGLIVFHNHPSGHCLPSANDKVLTIKLKQYIGSINVKLLDHIIVGKSTDYFSFQEEDLL